MSSPRTGILSLIRFNLGKDLGCARINHVGPPHVLDPAVHPAIVHIIIIITVIIMPEEGLK